MAIRPEDALTALPAGLRDDLVSAFNEIVKGYSEHRWEPAELNGGKLCEATYTVIRGVADGSFAPRSQKPSNMVDACKAMEAETAQPRSVRIQIPRMIVALYEIRNNRGVGHSGGDVDPNAMDATAVLYMSKWLLAELVRILHALSTSDAEQLVESLIERHVSLVWSRGDKKRVLRDGLTWKQKTLLLLLGETGEVDEANLFTWIEHGRLDDYRRNVLRPGHKQRLWEFDENGRTLALLPPGIDEAEALAAKYS